MDHPSDRVELDQYLERIQAAAVAQLGNRLICILLFGSWARGEATPPTSDVDLVIIVDTVDDTALDALARVWLEADIGMANVYGADEVPVMAPDALESYTTNAVVLYGVNPFRAPARADLARDLARQSEVLVRYARRLALCRWMTDEDRTNDIRAIRHKSGLRWGLRTVVGLRTGAFPRTWQDTRVALAGSDELELSDWLESMTTKQAVAASSEIGRRLNAISRGWFREARNAQAP